MSEQEILNALDCHIAVLDGDGNITNVNESWSRFSEENGGSPSSTGVGVNYFAVCRTRGATPDVESILSGIRAVMDGVIPHFRAEYPCHAPTQPRWFEVMVTPFPMLHHGAVLRHSYITELRQARDEYAVVLNSARGILWRAKVPGFQTTFTSKHVESILGYPVQAWLEPGFWIDRIHPQDRERVLAYTGRETQEGRNHEFEYRMISAAGRTVWLRNIVNVVVENGRPKEVVGISIDISEHKRAEEVMANVSRKLIEAQEQERTRIARELHDDVSQQLALLAVELDQWGQDSAHDAVLHNHLRRAKNRIAEIGRDVQTLSHRLHSSKLEYLGLVSAVKSLVKEISEMNHIKIDFKEDGVPRALPNEVSLSVFRILQQVLHNSIEHSETKNIEVRLWAQSNELHLSVKDSGKGFDVSSAMRGAGLGLTSMRERARLINGEIAIDSKPMGGTTIYVHIPLQAPTNLEPLSA